MGSTRQTWRVRPAWAYGMACVGMATALSFASSPTAAQSPEDTVATKRKAFMQAADDLARAKAKLQASDAKRDAAIAAFDAAAQANAGDLVARAKAAQDLTAAAEMDEAAVSAASAALAKSRRELLAELVPKPLPTPSPDKPLKEVELIANAAKAQGKVDKMEADSGAAFSTTDKASAIALAMAEKRLRSSTAEGDAKRELGALADSKSGHKAAMDVYAQRGGAQRLGNLVVASATQLADCRLRDAKADCTQHETESRQLQAILESRSNESAAKMALAKLASFKVQSADVADSESEQLAALEFLQLIDRNPKAGWKFGGEGATVTAGPDGGNAAVRFSLQRFVKSWARDTTITLSAPLAKEGDTRLLASNGQYRPQEASLRYEVAGLRSLKRSENTFTRFNQFGLFAEATRQRFSLGDVNDVTSAPRKESRTALSWGVSSLYALTDKDAVHRLGFTVERSYDAGKPSTRCKLTPDKVKDPATGQPTTTDESFLRCNNALFSPLEVAWSRTFEYRYRQELDHIAVAPAFSYENGTRTKTYELPIYLVRGDGDNEGKFTAGIAYRHISKPGEPADKRWELFVSSPLSLIGP